MAKEDFKREQEVLRLIWLEGGGYNREQMAEVLGLSPDSIDRALRDIRRALMNSDAMLDAWSDRPHIYQYFRPDLQRTDNLLMKLYSLRTLRMQECERYFLLLAALCEGPCSFTKLSGCVSQVEWTGWQVDKKAVKQYLDHLIETGLVRRESGHRGKYALDQLQLRAFDATQWQQLLDFCVYCANTSPFSALGFQLADTIRNWLAACDCEQLPVFRYRYVYFGRVLDEQLAYQLLSAIQSRRAIELRYYPRQTLQRYEAHKVYRRKSSSPGADRATVFPLKVVYDHEYGRWYLIGKEQDKPYISRYRLETIQQIAKLPAVPISQKQQEVIDQAESELMTSWGVGCNELTIVKVKFYKPDGTGPDFIRRRVADEGRWGNIIAETSNYLLWEITVADVQGITPWLRSFGSSAEVLEPIELRNLMIEAWKNMVEMYG